MGLMQVFYVLRVDTITDEDYCAYTVYGITALDDRGNELKTYKDLFFNKQKAEEFVDLCNTKAVELIHLQDMVEDAMTSFYQQIF